MLQLLDQIALTELKVTAGVAIGDTTAVQTTIENQYANEAHLYGAQTKSAAAGGEQRVLVVDDSPTVRKQIELGLLPYRVTVDLAETGERALELIARQTYVLVFLDVVLPGTDGYQVCKSIKKQAITKKTRVVMLTGKSSPFDRVRGTLAGCDAYLTKPVESKTFQGVLQKYLTVPAQQGGVRNAAAPTNA